MKIKQCFCCHYFTSLLLTIWLISLFFKTPEFLFRCYKKASHHWLVMNGQLQIPFVPTLSTIKNILGLNWFKRWFFWHWAMVGCTLDRYSVHSHFCGLHMVTCQLIFNEVKEVKKILKNLLRKFILVMIYWKYCTAQWWLNWLALQMHNCRCHYCTMRETKSGCSCPVGSIFLIGS